MLVALVDHTSKKNIECLRIQLWQPACDLVIGVSLFETATGVTSRRSQPLVLQDDEVQQVEVQQEETAVQKCITIGVCSDTTCDKICHWCVC